MKYTVIAFVDGSGQLIAEHVSAGSGAQAFWRLAQQRPELTMVVAIPGELTEGTPVTTENITFLGTALTFPGLGIASSDDILAQPEKFNL